MTLPRILSSLAARCASRARGARTALGASRALGASLGIGACFALGACTRPAPAPAASATRATVRAPEPGWPRELELPGGARLRIAQRPVRIVPANAGAVDLLSLLVGPERLAALPRQALRYSRLGADGGDFGALPRFERYQAEPLLAVQADLVICDPWGSPETSARLSEAGIAVLQLPDTTSWTDAKAALALLARAVGEEQRGASALAALEAREAALRARAAGLPRLRALCYSNYGGQGSSAGADTGFQSMLDLAGMTNALAAKGRRGHVGLSFEELLALDPDLIVVAERGEGEGAGGSAAVLRDSPYLTQLRAVREPRRILALDARLFAASSTELLAASEQLVERIWALLPLDAPAAPAAQAPSSAPAGGSSR